MSCDALIPTDLWLERSRFNGMTLGAFSYGIYFVLTIQAFHTVWNGPIKHSFRSGSSRSLTWRQRVFDRSSILLAYICITFVLATIGFAGNAKYSQMIWIDLRNRPGGPAALIEDELDFWINRMALACYYVMEWFMEALLLQRCFIIWNWAPYIVALMSVLFFADIAMAILVLTESKGAVFYNINVQLAYLCLSVGMNILYTLLVTGRLLAMRNSIREVLGSEHSTTYTSVVAMLTESAALYSVLGAIYIVSFAVHSNISNLIFLSISHVQGIAQLLIIIRVAQGRAFSHDITAHQTHTLRFAHPSTAQQTSAHLADVPSTSYISSNTSSGTEDKLRSVEATLPVVQLQRKKVGSEGDKDGEETLEES